jgi:hypothetical protein
MSCVHLYRKHIKRLLKYLNSNHLKNIAPEFISLDDITIELLLAKAIGFLNIET